MVTDYREISGLLTLLRRERGLTLTMAASRTGLARCHLRAIEAKVERPTLIELCMFARGYGVYLEIGIGGMSIAEAAVPPWQRKPPQPDEGPGRPT
jgi:hypothetical protein